MLTFYAGNFLKAVSRIEQARLELKADRPDALAHAATALNDAGGSAGQIGLSHLEERGGKALKDWNENKLTKEVALDRLDSMQDDLLHAMRQQLFMAVPSGDRHYYEDPLLTPIAAGRFPAADQELREAGKCFALDRLTASVFHAMRALEVGLKALADRLGVPPSPKPWGGIIIKIEKAIESYRATHPRDPFADFCSGVATHFRFVKDAHRNHVMHERQDYSRERAEEILSNATRVIEELAENGLRESP